MFLYYVSVFCDLRGRVGVKNCYLSCQTARDPGSELLHYARLLNDFWFSSLVRPYTLLIQKPDMLTVFCFSIQNNLHEKNKKNTPNDVAVEFV